MQQNLAATNPTEECEKPDLFINRELSWIEFNRRVFAEAKDSRHPVLERVKFLSIFDSNLDEFIMIRAAHVTSLSPDCLTPEQQLIEVRRCLGPLCARGACLLAQYAFGLARGAAYPYSGL